MEATITFSNLHITVGPSWHETKHTYDIPFLLPFEPIPFDSLLDGKRGFQKKIFLPGTTPPKFVVISVGDVLSENTKNRFRRLRDEKLEIPYVIESVRGGRAELYIEGEDKETRKVYELGPLEIDIDFDIHIGMK